MNNQIYASVSAHALSRRAGQEPRKRLLATIEGALIQVFDLVLSWHENVRTRRALAQLNDYMLSDIGLSRASAEREASTPFWR